MTTLKAGLIGLGAMGRNHARVLGAIDGIDFVAFHDPLVDEADVYGAAPSPSPHRLLSSGIDCCVIAAPTSEHEMLAELAAENGVSVLVEKPLAPTSDAARRLSDRFAEAGLIGCVGHIERFNPAAIALQQRLAEGMLGELYQLATRRQGPFPARIRDVGVIMDLATHDVDLTRWVTGSDYASIDAWTSHKSGRAHEDLVVAAGTMTSGLIVSHHVNWLTATKERVTVVTGERGTLVADTLNVDLTFFANGSASNEWDALAVFRGVGEGDMTRYALARREPLFAEVEAFRDAVLGVADATIPFSDGARAVETAEAMLRSAASRR